MTSFTIQLVINTVSMRTDEVWTMMNVIWYTSTLRLDLDMYDVHFCLPLFFCRDIWQETTLQHKAGTLLLREMMITRQMSRRCPIPLAQQHSRYLWGWPVVHWKPSFQRNEVSYDDYRFIYKAFPILASRTKSSKINTLTCRVCCCMNDETAWQSYL